ncbi:MAG TPA: UDP-N-acetylmuramoyl-tripeptide--D-alanyl-D-alanine ligase [Gemmatimonadota bacterium]|nr:UDP-N-acetylmuramoyl-tripeptide--D-alanyl-D-alanine ligase [Gemmatimonadota bacterium]
MSAQFTVPEVGAALERLHEGEARGTFRRVAIDSRRVLPGDLFVAIRGERHDGNRYMAAAVESGAAGVVGEDRPFEGRDRVAFWPAPDGRAALQALAGFHRRRLDVRVVGVTGSNGKTTTKELVAAVLSQGHATARTAGNLNNQIGVPLTLLEIGSEHRWAVVEMGMNQPGEIAPLARISAPDVAVVTNVAASHLEGLGSVEAVMEEKLELPRALGPNGLFVYHGDQPMLREAARKLSCRSVSYGLHPSNDLAPDEWSLDEDGRGSFRVEGRTFRLRLTGKHNIVNALAAVAVGREAGLPVGAIAGGVAEPDSLPLRMQLERWGEVVALVDCYNANPESVISAAATLSTLSGVRRRVAVLGEMLELGPASAEWHEWVGRELGKGAVDLVVAVGPGAAPIAAGAEAAGLATRTFADRRGAEEWLVENVMAGDAILFKASRGAELETVVKPVRDACLEGAPAINGNGGGH